MCGQGKYTLKTKCYILLHLLYVTIQLISFKDTVIFSTENLRDQNNDKMDLAYSTLQCASDRQIL